MPIDLCTWMSLLMAKLSHDLASPLGAIGLGIEILEDNPTDSPTYHTLKESYLLAELRLKYYRLIFSEKPLFSEVHDLVNRLAQLKNVTLEWREDGIKSQSLVALVAPLAYLSIEAMLKGGTLTISLSEKKITLQAEGPRIQWGPNLLDILGSPLVSRDLCDTRTILAFYLRYQSQSVNKKIDCQALDRHKFSIVIS